LEGEKKKTRALNLAKSVEERKEKKLSSPKARKKVTASMFSGGEIPDSFEGFHDAVCKRKEKKEGGR